MGCCSSEPTRSVTRSPTKYTYAVEKYKTERAASRGHPNLLESRRRKPVLKVPEKVVAPSCPQFPSDAGENVYQSMLSSPRPSYMAFPLAQRKKAHLDAIDDVDEPPNHETLQAYIGHLDMFMRDVRTNPHTLKKRIAKLRSSMRSTDSDDSVLQ